MVDNLNQYCRACEYSGYKLPYQLFVDCDEGKKCKEIQRSISNDGVLTRYDIFDRSAKVAETLVARK